MNNQLAKNVTIGRTTFNSSRPNQLPQLHFPSLKVWCILLGLGLAFASVNSFAQSDAKAGELAPATEEKCRSLLVTGTSVPGGKAIAVLAAPCKGKVTAYAQFKSTFQGPKPATASLTGNLNGVSIGAPTDYDFANTTVLTIPRTTIPVTRGATVTFDTTRKNSGSIEVKPFVMTLEFMPD